MVENQRARNFRRIIVFSTITVFFVVLLVLLASMARELILPVVLGVFFGYLLRPMVRLVEGPPLWKYMKTIVLFGTIGVVGYFSIYYVKSSLPSEKEKLELLVRLQYRVNKRYNEWLQVDAQTGKGNVFYNLLGKDLDPVLKKVNDFLSLDADQRKLFLLYRKGYGGEAPIEDKYYQYFLHNLKIIKAVEAEHEAQQAAEAHMAGQTLVAGAKPESGGGIAVLFKLFSIWLAFPLTLIFVMLDKGQILHFCLSLVPNRYFELTRTVFDKVDEALGHYIRGTMLECLLVGMTILVGMWACGFRPKVYILLGLVGGLTNAIPFVGPALAFLIGGVFALIAENINPLLPFIDVNNLIVAVMVVVAVAQLLDNAVYQPLVVGGAVNIHPLVVILGVFIGSLAFGFAGLLLAIPVIVILKVVTETLIHGLKAYRII